jgi:flagellar biosynthesis protein FlhF
MAEALELVRVELGQDAIIIRSQEADGNKGASITAAYEGLITPDAEPEADVPDIASLMGEAIHAKHRDNADTSFDLDELIAVLEHHGVPHEMSLRLQTAAASFAAENLEEALSSALDTSFRFYNLPETSNRPFILVGPTGAGKTIASAKIAAEAVIHKKNVEIITIDTIKSTGFEQLQNFASMLKCQVAKADSPEKLAAILENRPKGENAPDLTIIDTFGVNPFDKKELESLARFIKAGKAEPVLIMPAGLDPVEAGEIAQIFASMGTRLFVPTKLDAVRRYASVLTAAQTGGLTIVAIGNSPIVADQLRPASPLLLGQLIGQIASKRDFRKEINNQDKRATI